MAKEYFEAEDKFEAGDKVVVPKDPELWKYGIFIIEGVLPYHIIAHPRTNGENTEKIIPKSDVHKIKENEQLLMFSFCYDES